jgi:phospholipid-translocating ATPase
MLMFDTLFLTLVTVSYSALVFTELLNVFTLVDRLNINIVLANGLSLLFYIFSVIYLRKNLDVQQITLSMLIRILIITAVCWAPFELLKWLTKIFFPSLSDKIMMNVIKKEKNNLDEGNGDLLESKTSI